MTRKLLRGKIRRAAVTGAAAHRVRKGDLAIIAAFSWMDEKAARTWKPRVVFVDQENRPVEGREERGRL